MTPQEAKTLARMEQKLNLLLHIAGSLWRLLAALCLRAGVRPGQFPPDQMAHICPMCKKKPVSSVDASGAPAYVCGCPEIPVFSLDATKHQEQPRHVHTQATAPAPGPDHDEDG